MTDTTLTALLETHGSSISATINVALPARIVSFDSTAQTAKVEVLISNISLDDTEIPVPVLSDVPVQMLSYGGFCITAEPKSGDEGLLQFADKCIDGWWASGKRSIPLDYRSHDFSDAFFSIGYKSKPNALKIVKDTLHVGSDSCYLRIKENGEIEVKGKTKFLDEVTAPDFKTESGISLANHKHDPSTGSPV